MAVYVRYLTADERNRLVREWNVKRSSDYNPATLTALEKRIHTALVSGYSWPVSRIATDLSLSERTVRTWIAVINKTKQGTLTVDDSRDRKRPGRAPVYDAARIAEVARTPPATVGLPHARWTLASLQDYLNDHHGIGIKRSRLSDVLNKSGIRLD
jgi:transposase